VNKEEWNGIIIQIS